MPAESVAGASPRHFVLSQDGDVSVVALNRPERKNPLTFESYAELRDLFRGLVYRTDVKVVVITSLGSNFCSGGDVFAIRAADAHGHGRAARVHPDDGRSGEGDPPAPSP